MLSKLLSSKFLLLSAFLVFVSVGCQQSSSPGGNSGGGKVDEPKPPEPKPENCKPKCADKLRNLTPFQVQTVWGRTFESLHGADVYLRTDAYTRRVNVGFQMARTIQKYLDLQPNDYTSETFAKLYTALFDSDGKVIVNIDSKKIAESL